MTKSKCYLLSFLVCGTIGAGLFLAFPDLVESRADPHRTGGTDTTRGVPAIPDSAPDAVENVSLGRRAPGRGAPVATASDLALRWLGSHQYTEIDDAPTELVPWIALHHAKATVAKDPAGTFRELQHRQELTPGLTPWSFDMVFKEWYSVAPAEALKFFFSQDNRLSKWTQVNVRVAADLAPQGATAELQELVEACGGDAHDDVVACLVEAACNATAWDAAKEIALMTNDEARRLLVLKAIEARRNRKPLPQPVTMPPSG